ncbi:helix-turn-helix domain-containing protein [Actinospica durhamensis]|uniref:Helix-turn-helix domain-containing protein n=1 Tax=Actinospica durhamensis TaxID=1508375 RepID=A0A941ERM8_9ACTN|nr:helix-turn-helix domain-containing protein [Actinospica durhamensis]MBR7836215.1 helix-turn-helix domain-containing protein [Actinospica durhamensis]
MGPDLQELVDEAARITEMAVTLEDREFNLVAFCAHRTVGDAVRQDSILTRRSTDEVRSYYESFGIARAAGPMHIPADPQRRLLGRVCVPVRWQSVTYGYLWLLEDRAVDPALLPELLDLAGRAGAELARHSRWRDDLGWKVGELLSTFPETRAKAAAEIAESWFRDEAVPVAAVVLRSLIPTAADAPVNAWRLPRTVLVGTGEHSSTFIVPLGAAGDLTAARAVARTALTALGPEHPAVAGIGGPVATLAQARASWLQARIAARVAAFREERVAQAGQSDRAEPADQREWPELGVHRLLGVAPDASLREALAHPGIERLLREGGAELVRTARAYLDEAGSAQRTAQALGIHRQTLYHRLERIERLTGLDLDSGRDRLGLHLALVLLPRLD